MKIRYMLAIVLIISATAAGARAASIDDFIKETFAWGAGERPKLIMSRGALIAWVQDPTTSPSIGNPRQFFESGESRIVVVPPGKALILFPPRIKSSKYKARASRQSHQLAVTEDGIWGIFNLSNPSLFLDEADLQKLARDERDKKDGFETFAMWVSTGVDIDLSAAGDGSFRVGFTRGEIIRILKREAEQAQFDLNAPLMLFEKKRDEIAAKAKKENIKTPLSWKLTFDPNQLRLFQILDSLVPPEQLDAWISAAGYSGSVFSYQELFERSFASIRVPEDVETSDGICGETLKEAQKKSLDASATERGEISGKWSLWSWFSTSASISAEGKQGFMKAIEKSSERTSWIQRRLHAVEVRAPNAQTTVIFAGRARTCKATPDWWTLIAITKEGEEFLHTEFAQMNREGVLPPNPTDPTKPQLAALKPGGNPFQEAEGVIVPQCFAQMLQFQRLAENRLADAKPAAVRATIALAIKRNSIRDIDLQTFFSDRKCAVAPH
jgi:hypothetical protein